MNQICLNFVSNHVVEQFQLSCNVLGEPSLWNHIRKRGGRVWETGSKAPLPGVAMDRSPCWALNSIAIPPSITRAATTRHTLAGPQKHPTDTSRSNIRKRSSLSLISAGHCFALLKCSLRWAHTLIKISAVCSAAADLKIRTCKSRTCLQTLQKRRVHI